MTVEYVVLGILLIVAGALQAWLRHGPAGKAIRAEQEVVAERRAKAGMASVADKRRGKIWSSWTAVLGGVSALLGVVLVVMGLMGR